ncbi:Serpentine receptor class alpha [Trichuris trichiura]|uniref:Serpentine receptor class alpha n=1 Tax=Trichuris trichiura TaxID=36087 RepID=A0A077ZKI2_TRITR|nr:Serpentine receptor class alpha [Trichuris trichiura]
MAMVMLTRKLALADKEFFFAILNYTMDINANDNSTTTGVAIYLVETMLMACGGIFGSLTNLALFRSVRCSRLLHANVRMLLLHSIIACGVVCFRQMIQGIASSMIIVKDVFNLHITKKACVVMQAPSVICFLVFSLCITALGAERLLATLKNCYDDNERSSTGVKAFVTVAWVGGIFNALIFFLLPNQELVLQYCSVFLFNISPQLYVTCGLYCAIAIITVVIYWLTYKLNSSRVLSFSINRATHSLQERFQLRNNVSITIALLPCVLSNSITFLLFFGTLTIAGAFFVREEQLDLRLVNCYLLLLNLLCINIIIQPIVLLKRCQKLRLIKLDWPSNLLSCILAKSSSNQPPSSLKTSIVQFHVNPESQEALMQTFWSNKYRMDQHRNSPSRLLCCRLIPSNARR